MEGGIRRAPRRGRLGPRGARVVPQRALTSETAFVRGSGWRGRSVCAVHVQEGRWRVLSSELTRRGQCSCPSNLLNVANPCDAPKLAKASRHRQQGLEARHTKDPAQQSRFRRSSLRSHKLSKPGQKRRPEDVIAGQL